VLLDTSLLVMRLGEFRLIEASLHCGIIQYQLTVFFWSRQAQPRIES
jgi:hypothetical protein